MCLCNAVPKLVIRDITDSGREPDGLCPTTTPITRQTTDPTLSTTTAGNGLTTTGSGVDSEYHLQEISTSAPPRTLPSEYGRYYFIISIISIIIVIKKIYKAPLQGLSGTVEYNVNDSSLQTKALRKYVDLV